MGKCEIRSAKGRRHGRWVLVPLSLLVFSTGSGAGPIAQSLTLPAGVGQVSPASELIKAGSGPVVASKAESAAAPDTAVSRAVCLKEGEACNPLNDLCCPGYYCPGGLARTCAPKP